MNAEQVIQFVQGVGFPAAVAAFVLIRVESRLEKLADAVEKLALAVAAK